ncbi:CDP-diacylglycerol--glycerol-3-phosphate 3-phosphatidyltransferase [Rhodothermus profundi]|uniref:CDP-diacylglycerol--glycerol-3-phosphate 3-phosphatidyltransferase n=1 Tax=Rhodothermus profundi TaxID=633813 RepID=A0A1M6PUH7_9BACT|nr:CDP-diacylglycerol--glycerol-3-phosphate 3-phosphatidyltransferase [Rhodothermus profundi]SHK11654.1 CDP-diacylglycerol--glycerol-3-phosphate 3-phosphatidyltransferase [Rhodothermus profundi]
MRHLPNALTIARIVLTPVLLVLLLSGTFTGQLAALGLFVAAAISDYLDGKLARSFRARSRLGQFLDPFADKVLVLGTFVCLAILLPHQIPWWAVGIIAGRDLLVTALRTWAEARGQSLRTLPLAKTKTTVQLVFLIGMLLLLVLRQMPGTPGMYALQLLEGPVPRLFLLGLVALTVLTGFWYVQGMWRRTILYHHDA